MRNELMIVVFSEFLKCKNDSERESFLHKFLLRINRKRKKNKLKETNLYEKIEDQRLVLRYEKMLFVCRKYCMDFEVTFETLEKELKIIGDCNDK